MRFGIHAGPQDCSIADLRRLWRIADERGFHWCSVWDHLFSVSDLSDPAKPAFEGVATMAALASETKRVRVGCLVFCVCYRPVGLLAKAAVTIDHRSEEHTSELQSRLHLVCRLLLEKKKKKYIS